MSKILAATALSATLALPALAGGLAEPVMQPTVVAQQTTSSAAGIIVPLLLLVLIAAAASGGKKSPVIHD